MASKSELCSGQVDAILKITEINQLAKEEYALKLDNFNKRMDEYQTAHNTWQSKKDFNSRVPDANRGTWVEANGKAYDCSTMGNSLTCCRDSSTARKKCKLQGKGSKCSNEGVCTWFGRGLSCISGCADASTQYAKNNVVSNTLPVTNSLWWRHKYPEPTPPTDKPILQYQNFPTIICQDCSTSMELIENEDTLATGLSQVSQCINNLEIKENEETGNGSGSGSSNSVGNVGAPPFENNDNSNDTSNNNSALPPPSLPNTNNNNNGNSNSNVNSNSSVVKEFILEWWEALIFGIIAFFVFVVMIMIILSASSSPTAQGEFTSSISRTRNF